MDKANWYENVKINRVKYPDGRLKHIDITAPKINGEMKLVRVQPGSTTEFLADLVFGLQYELEAKVEELRQANDNIGMEIH